MNNNVFREYKPFGPTGKGKKTTGVFVSFRVAIPANMWLLKPIWLTKRPSLSRNLYWPMKFQIFIDQNTNSPYIYAAKYRTKN